MTIALAITVNDYDAFTHWTQTVLDSVVTELHRDDTGFVHHAVLSIHGSALLLGTADPLTPPPSDRAIIYITGMTTTDIDAAHQKAFHQGTPIICAPTLAPYDVYETWLTDTEGFTWVLCNYTPPALDVTAPVQR